MTSGIRDLLISARSLIRDGLVMDYDRRDLSYDPESVISMLTVAIGDRQCLLCRETDGYHDRQCTNAESEANA